jgi:2Fe-2S ferredoxin
VSRVRIEPRGLEVEAAPGETVMAAAQRVGLRWPTVCGGQAECGVCVLEVLAAPVAPAPAGAEEAARLADLPETRRDPERALRLACRLLAVDGLVVAKRGVVPVG